MQCMGVGVGVGGGGCRSVGVGGVGVTVLRLRGVTLAWHHSTINEWQDYGGSRVGWPPSTEWP
jgi:hypothetical protein